MGHLQEPKILEPALNREISVISEVKGDWDCVFDSELSKLLKELGMKVKKLRSSVGLSQGELALKANVDRGYLSAIENGRQNPSLAAVLKLALALEVSIVDLLLRD